jgi:hypothetical protein
MAVAGRNRISGLVRVLQVGAVVVVALAGAAYMVDSSQNRGWTFGYYGEFNRVSNALTRIPAVRIWEAAPNLDLSLEEFSFELKTTNQATIKLFFAQKDPVRKLKGAALQEALEKRVGAELTNRNVLNAEGL